MGFFQAHSSFEPYEGNAQNFFIQFSRNKTTAGFYENSSEHKNTTPIFENGFFLFYTSFCRRCLFGGKSGHTVKNAQA